MKFVSCRQVLSAALLTAVLVSPALAQPPGGGRQGGRQGGGPGGPGGGFGRMGGGMMGGMMGGGDAMLLGILRVEEVQKELEMMEDQVQAVGKLEESLRDSGPRPDFQRLRDASEEEREKMMEEMRKAGEERSKKITEELEVILFPEQLERGRQIVLQQQGPGAFASPDVVKKLELTEEQQTKIRENQEKAREEMGEQMRELAQNRDFETMRTKMKEFQDKQMEQNKAVLNDKQKETFAKMLGEPFEMPEGAMGGFGRGGRGQGGPGGPGGQGGGRRGGNRGNDA